MAEYPPLQEALLERLSVREYKADECTAAIHGQLLPHALGYPVARLCVLRGIRYHPGFAQELHGITPEFTRALNARSIMSNVIPDMNNPDELPYCIWHPDVASESTYRGLARRYPHMVYHVARACAVAGYTDLYLELDVLPEVHVAEEARSNGSMDISDAIMANPIKYAVMDDYTRTVNIAHPRAAHLNGDTAVRSSLDAKQKYGQPVGFDLSENLEDWDEEDDWVFSQPGYEETHYFNITEDYGIDDHEAESPELGDVAPLLYSPLPLDLPAVNKDVLILMAAYYGDIDRYTRLRRPAMIDKEPNCVIRGIYHNTMFAKWWSLQSTDQDGIRCAINARFIMSNDLSRITADTPITDIPYCIWFPTRSSWRTYEEVARRRPDMKPQIARACIVADYKTTYDQLDVVPDAALLAEARDSPNPHYLRDLERKVVERGLKFNEHVPAWMFCTRKVLFEPPLPHSGLSRRVDTSLVSVDFPFIYDGASANASGLELSVCPREMLKPGEDYLNLEEVFSRPVEESSR